MDESWYRTIMLALIWILTETAVGRDYTLCRDTSAVSELEGEIFSPTSADITPSFEPVSCTLRINNISAGSWVGIFNMGTFRNEYAQQTGIQCSEQAAYLSIYHPKTGSRDFCKPDRGVILTAYSALPAHLQFDFTSTRTGYQYGPGNVAFGLTYRVARSVHTRVNHVIEEEAEFEGSIVSHSSYPDPYISGIDSTLTLTGLKLAATMDVAFSMLDFHSNCRDYLEIKGLRSSDLNKGHICSDIERLKGWTKFQTTSTSISFRFVTANQEGGQGFRFNYRVTDNTGCPDIQIPNSRVEANLTDITGRVFTVTCDEGLSFSNISRQSVQVSCENGRWFVSTDCKDNCQIDRLECVCENEKNLSENGVTCKTTTTVRYDSPSSTDRSSSRDIVIIGLSTTVCVLFIILLVITVIILVRKKQTSHHKPSKEGVGIKLDSNAPQSPEHTQLEEGQPLRTQGEHDYELPVNNSSDNLDNEVGNYEEPDSSPPYLEMSGGAKATYVNTAKNGNTAQYEQTTCNQDPTHVYTSLM